MEVSWHSLLSGMDGWQGLMIVAKALLYGCSFAAAGGSVFLSLFSSRLNQQEQLAIRRTVVGTALAAMLFTIAYLAATNGMLGGEWAGIFDWHMTAMVLATQTGPSIGARIGGLILLTLLGNARITHRLFLLPLLGAILTAASFGMAGHAGELSANTISIPQVLIILHLFAITFWLGALRPLHHLTHGKDIARIAFIMQSFGKMALYIVGILITSGAILLWLLLGSAGALWQSAYGQLMMFKLAGVVSLLLLAAMNKLRWTPALLAGQTAASISLRRSIIVEMVVAMLILFTTATITTLAGPPAIH